MAVSWSLRPVRSRSATAVAAAGTGVEARSDWNARITTAKASSCGGQPARLAGATTTPASVGNGHLASTDRKASLNWSRSRIATLMKVASALSVGVAAGEVAASVRNGVGEGAVAVAPQAETATPVSPATALRRSADRLLAWIGWRSTAPESPLGGRAPHHPPG